MTFDPMATAIDWLDAYRAGDIDAILAMSSDAAVVECGCSNRTIIGKEGLRAYWEQSLRDYPASELDDLQPSGSEVMISYVARDSVVGATLAFDPEGRIARLRCAASRSA
jgi:hypothetical protein